MIKIKPEFKLFPNQRDNVQGFLTRPRALLTDKVGSGKTMSILYAFAHLQSKNKLKNMIVFTPKSAYEKRVWEMDIQKWTMLKCISLDVLVKRIDGKFENLTKLLSNYDVITAKYSHIKQYKDYIDTIFQMKGMMVALDEVHSLRSQKSQLTQLFKLSLARAKYIWGCTGTPLSKSLEDTYNIINTIRPWFLGTFPWFRENYCITKEKVIGRTANGLRKAIEIVGVKDAEALALKLEPLVIKGVAFTDLQYHFIDYSPSKDEQNLYRKIANGIDLCEAMKPEEWIKYITSSTEVNNHPIKEVERHSSRFIYLQSAADGILSNSGTQDKKESVKLNLLMEKIEDIVSRKESVLIYFEYLAPLEIVRSVIEERRIKAKVLVSTGENTLSDKDVTEGKVKMVPHVILCTKAASESASYYFINNVIMFHIPTVPHTFIQMTGRITRKNTLFPGDLHCYLFRSSNIDLYKLMVVSNKAAQMEIVSGEDLNLPSDYKKVATKTDMIQKAKKILLWNT